MSRRRQRHGLRLFFLSIGVLLVFLTVLKNTILGATLNSSLAVDLNMVDGHRRAPVAQWGPENREYHKSKRPLHSNGHDQLEASFTPGFSVNVNTHTMTELLAWMVEKTKASTHRGVKKLRKWESAKLFLQFLVEKSPAMFPIVGTVPATVDPQSLTNIQPKEYKGMDKEDRLIYERFLNENTRQCHTFGEAGLFESGAYKGVAKSNTFFFEKHFSMATTLVEASAENWPDLDRAVADHRPLSSVYHAALCPVGDKTVCVEQDSSGVTEKNGVQRVKCKDEVPCFDFDDSKHYSLISLDIEGFEWEFIKFRKIKADIVLVEVIQWLRDDTKILTAVEFVAYMASIGYYLYASPTNMIGGRNFVFLSRNLVDDCFADYVIHDVPAATTASEQ